MLERSDSKPHQGGYKQTNTQTNKLVFHQLTSRVCVFQQDIRLQHVLSRSQRSSWSIQSRTQNSSLNGDKKYNKLNSLSSFHPRWLPTSDCLIGSSLSRYILRPPSSLQQPVSAGVEQWTNHVPAYRWLTHHAANESSDPVIYIYRFSVLCSLNSQFFQLSSCVWCFISSQCKEGNKEQ